MRLCFDVDALGLSLCLLSQGAQGYNTMMGANSLASKITSTEVNSQQNALEKFNPGGSCSLVTSRRDIVARASCFTLLATCLSPVNIVGADDDIASSSEQKDSSPPISTEIQPFNVKDLSLPYNGKQISLEKLLGPKATLVINGKLDDPVALQQMPDIVSAATKYGKDGLHVLIIPTDQGYFEPDEDRVVKIKFYQFYGFGQFPVAIVLDKVDIVGNKAHPLYKYMCRTLKNPYGIGRITLNYEKFLLDSEGHPLRRYPRQLSLSNIKDDISAALRGDPLPPPSRVYSTAWVKAKVEAERSEYAFKLGLNYYNNIVQ